MDGVTILFCAVFALGGCLMFAAGYQLGLRRGKELAQNDYAKRTEQNKRKSYHL